MQTLIKDQGECSSTSRAAKQFWAYVNPLNGRYASMKGPLSLLLFPDAEQGRKEELKSPCLRTLVGHFISDSEARQLANEKTEGRVVLMDNGKVLPLVL